MPSYFASFTLKSITEPTGSSAGSAAITPFCTATPDVVTRPLQYAVALKGMRAPGAGGATGSNSRSSANGSIENFESGIVTPYNHTNPPIASNVTNAFHRIERANPMQKRVPERDAQAF